MKHNAPVLLLTYVRVDYARQVFDAIKKAQPRKFYFYSNRPKSERTDLIEKNEIIRSWAKEVDWECELHTFFAEEYEDVYPSEKRAFDWFFENEEEGIIFEDDCLPSPAFFDYCELMLEKFRDDKRIGIISGNNLYGEYNPHDTDYLFSHYFVAWGWATWKDRYQSIDWDDVDINRMINASVFDAYFNSRGERELHKKFFSKLNIKGKWEYMFFLTNIINGRINVHPRMNLIQNIGVIGEHNNGKESSAHKAVISDIENYTVTKPPKYVVEDFLYDEYIYKKICKELPLYNRIKNKFFG